MSEFVPIVGTYVGFFGLDFSYKTDTFSGRFQVVGICPTTYLITSRWEINENTVGIPSGK